MAGSRPGQARIRAISYDPATLTATLPPGRRAVFPRADPIVVLTGVIDLAGNALDGGQSGVAGSKQVVIVRRPANR